MIVWLKFQTWGYLSLSIIHKTGTKHKWVSICFQGYCIIQSGALGVPNRKILAEIVGRHRVRMSRMNRNGATWFFTAMFFTGDRLFRWPQIWKINKKHSRFIYSYDRLVTKDWCGLKQKVSLYHHYYAMSLKIQNHARWTGRTKKRY